MRYAPVPSIGYLGLRINFVTILTRIMVLAYGSACRSPQGEVPCPLSFLRNAHVTCH